MARRTKEEAQQTREQLIDAAEIVFHRKGVAQTSLNEIAQEAKLTRGAFYWHFKNKQDVFKAMLDRQTLQFGQLESTQEKPDEPNPLMLLRASILFVIREIETDPSRRRVYEIVFQKCEMTAQNEPISTLLHNNALIGFERMRSAFVDAIEQGYAPHNLDVEAAITHLHIQVTGAVYLWLLLPGTFDLQAQATRLLDLFFNQLPEHFLRK